jgi:hypothetical protein
MFTSRRLIGLLLFKGMVWKRAAGGSGRKINKNQKEKRDKK